MSTPKIYTKKAMSISSVRLPVTSVSLLREAAARQGISSSEFIRRAIRTEATRALLDGREERPQ